LFLALVTLAPRAEAAAPCCVVVAIDAKSGLVTAKNFATGKTFQFKVGDKALLKGLKIGQKVAADFASGKVTVDGISPCCNIVQPAVKDLQDLGK